MEQCGTTGFVNSSGTTEYFPWYEFAPAALVQITSFNVNPGDKMFAEVTYLPSQSTTGHYAYNFIVDDQTTSNSFNQTIFTTSNDQRSSAEWIAEAAHRWRIHSNPGQLRQRDIFQRRGRTVGRR